MPDKLSYAVINAAAIAASKDIPDHAGQSAYPPKGFWVDGDQLGILCADGRKVFVPLVKYLPAPAKVVGAGLVPAHASKPALTGGKKAGK